MQINFCLQTSLNESAKRQSWSSERCFACRQQIVCAHKAPRSRLSLCKMPVCAQRAHDVCKQHKMCARLSIPSSLSQGSFQFFSRLTSACRLPIRAMATSSVKKDIESLLKIRLPTYLKNYSVSGTHKTANAAFSSFDWSFDLKRRLSHTTCLTLDITMDNT